MGNKGSLVILIAGLAAAAACSRKPAADTARGTSSPSSPESRVPSPAPRVLYWYDPMKPEVHFDHPGKSPFMDMELLPKYAEVAPPAPAGGQGIPPGYSVVRIPLERRQQIGVTTSKVERRAIGGTVETNGVVAEDEARVHAVNAKFSGYVERIYADRTGQSVRRGQALLSVYSPDLVATEREYLLALENLRRLSGSSNAESASDARALVDAARQRLWLWDISEAEIDRIQRTGKVSRTLDLPSPVSGVVLKKDAVAGLAITAGMPLYTIADLSSVWVLADVYQSEIGSIAPGARAEIAAPFLPGDKLRGRIDFVYPTLTEETRTVKVRVAIPNPTGLLKPGMYVRVSFAGKERQALAVPSSALIQTGERQIVFVEQSPGVYAPREVKTGAQGKDLVEVLAGLAAGETVVMSANFLIDSESRIGAIGTAPAGASGQPAQSLQPTPGGPQ